MSKWNRWLLGGSLSVVLVLGMGCKKDEEAEDYSGEETTLATEDTSTMATESTTMSTDMGTESGTAMSTDMVPPPAPTPSL